MGLNKIKNYVESYNAESVSTGIGRSVIAFAHLVTIILTPLSSLSPPLGGPSNVYSIQKCDGVSKYLLFCLFKDYEVVSLSISIFILLVVIAGIFPRYTAWLHFYFCLSFNNYITLPDGGDLIAQHITLFIALAMINDRRRWHWIRGLKNESYKSSVFQGISASFHFAVRIQLFYIYFDAAISKIYIEEWQTGTAMYYVVRSEYFGTSGIIGEITRYLTSYPAITLLMTWGAIACEVVMAIFILSNKNKNRLVALFLAVFLHLVIALFIGIWSFVIIMIGSNIVAASGAFKTTLPHGIKIFAQNKIGR